jgi:ADP-ribose pyrophosphatase
MPEFDDPRLRAPQCTTLIPVATVHENPWFKVKRRGDFYTTEYPALDVIILPVVEHEAVLMVRVKRPVVADVTLELPAGSTKPAESPLRAAARELEEETGIRVSDLKRFEMISPLAGSPNRNPLLLNIFSVNITGSEYQARGSHDDEITAVELLPFRKVRELIAQGDIYVAVPVAVLSRYLLLRTKGLGSSVNQESGCLSERHRLLSSMKKGDHE